MSSLGLGDLGVSYIRTYAPGVAAVGLTAIGDAVGIEIPGIAKEHAGVLAVFVLWVAWYGLFRWAEQRWPKAGAFLGVPAAPVYEPLQGEHEFEETLDANGNVTYRKSVTRYPNQQ
jgi:hypothetical protein